MPARQSGTSVLTVRDIVKILPDFISADGPLKAMPGRAIEFVIENAVLYYVSCCLLLLGTYLIMHSSWLSADFLMRYIETYSLFLAYAISLSGLCLLVLRRLGLVEDGLVMAGMALFLILDPTFFNNVFYTYKLNVGLIVNSICFVFSLSLYAALTKIGRVPWTRRSAALTALAGLFVYFYPAGLNAGWTEETVGGYFYGLWWMPLVVALLCERLLRRRDSSEQANSEHREETDATGKRSGSAAIAERMRQRFLIACILIVTYIVLSHLAEANYTYSLEFHAEYLTPTFLAAGILFFKSKPELGSNGRSFLWICAVMAACCSFAGAGSTFRLPWGVILSPFHHGLGAVALFMLYFWKTYRNRSWAMAAVVCMLLVVSGHSLPDSVSNISHFHFLPFAYLAIVFAVFSAIERVPVFPTLAGACLLITILSLTTIPGPEQLVIFLQTGAVWAAVVQWYFYQESRQGIYSLAGAFVFLLSVVMFCGSTHRLAWGADYVIVVFGLFFAGWLLENGFLRALSLSGAVGVPLYFARNQLVSAGTALRRIVNSGLLAMITAFLLLPLAYCLSAVKMRRRANR
jgi:hypothetical protein